MRSNGIHFSLALIASLGIISLAGCGSGDGDSARLAQTVDASKNTVTKIAIADNEQYVHFKSFYQFELIGSDNDNNQVNLTNKATWKISDPSLGTIKNGYFDASGVSGNFTLTAEYAGLVSTQEINVSDANLVKVTVKHASASVEECKNTTFTADAEFDNGKILPYPLTWAVVEGNTNGNFRDATKGILSTTNSGSLTIVASGTDNNGKEIPSNALNFTVSEGLTKISVAIDKSSTEMRDGETATVTVKGTYNDPANPVDITQNAGITATPAELLKIEGAKITAQNGTVNGSKVTLKGACGGVEGTQELTVKERELKSIQIKSNDGATSNLIVAEGSELDLKATATYMDNGTVDDYANVVWEIDDRNNNIPSDQEDEVTISSSGEISVSDELNLGVNAPVYVIAEVQDSAGNVVKNSSGTEIKAQIVVTITPN